mmetsp:Transcript_20595/g.44773  ORF Transcript_20595/g.44773 Transcript_20595/m.44773 type:complete len:256 (-) Transcript_20595:209-976(-)
MPGLGGGAASTSFSGSGGGVTSVGAGGGSAAFAASPSSSSSKLTFPTGAFISVFPVLSSPIGGDGMSASFSGTCSSKPSSATPVESTGLDVAAVASPPPVGTTKSAGLAPPQLLHLAFSALFGSSQASQVHFVLAPLGLGVAAGVGLASASASAGASSLGASCRMISSSISLCVILRLSGSGVTARPSLAGARPRTNWSASIMASVASLSFSSRHVIPFLTFSFVAKSKLLSRTMLTSISSSTFASSSAGATGGE